MQHYDKKMPGEFVVFQQIGGLTHIGKVVFDGAAIDIEAITTTDYPDFIGHNSGHEFSKLSIYSKHGDNYWWAPASWVLFNPKTKLLTDSVNYFN